ncbi:MFS transporter [Promicromonospora thailandica]|uniref:Arabinose efflux permease, MFS family n=1 Tax=Promicromonospora thailandica TaxID=765201 RepID=A0A9X2JVW0_9MICO|nr:MFS transporter [Promicromonospora thailandica]MCP2265501.1 putative arabinose efflux permease, MFS family [Promicromonospora thailandica]BFF17057.1 hypothetical protein GCM10025730_05780 [Promicromonospora thailandica]
MHPTRRSARRTLVAAALVLAVCLWASGAPSVLYPAYAARWDLTPLTVTSVFATYPLALLVMLVLAGGLADVVGRRRAMLAGLTLIGLGAVSFAVAQGVGLLFVGRALQGVGVGLAMSAASAAVVESFPDGARRSAGTVTTASTSGGLVLAMVVGGTLAQLAPLPLVLTYVVLAVATVVTLALVLLTPHSRGTTRDLRPRLPRFARGTGRHVVIAALAVVVAYSVGAVFMALGAQMARQLTGTTSLLVIGLLLGLSSAVIGVTALVLARVDPSVSVAVGAAVSLAGLALMVVTGRAGSLGVFVAWCVVSGIGYSLTFAGGVGIVGREAPATHRAGTFSLVYLAGYFFQTVVSVGLGALATAHGLPAAIDVGAAGVGALGVGLLAAAVVDLRRTRYRRLRAWQHRRAPEHTA